MLYIIGVFISYLLGSIPMGVLLARMAKLGDLQKVGSGNIGAANVMRVGGLRMAGLVWILDMAKAIAAFLMGKYIGGDVFATCCGVVAMFGHCFPVWLHFRGGKGVSCLFGILLVLNPILFVVCGIEWLVVALTFGFSSLGGLVVFLVAPVLGFAIGPGVGFALVAASVLCIWKHRENIGRLVGGTESKLNWKWKK